MEKSAVFDAFAEVVKALANGRRLELLELLAQGEHRVEALAQLTATTPTATSTHLQILRRAGLVRARRVGTSVYYRLAGDDVAQLFTAAKQVALLRFPELRDALGTYLGRAGGEHPVIAAAAVTSKTVVIDVRPRPEYEAGHFPGAFSIPQDELEQRYHEIPEGSPVVVYCRGELCRMAREAAFWLRERGIDARAMDEGVVEWRADAEVELDVA
ncbi:ArsR/SmtB family transcription factor [Rhodococcus yananensis]|uniref:ArsR/SmtB family transcription factor n=1 Tax=Rhodococcus yananensis TaxID=2879464 RepID=UPI003EBA995D